MGEGSRLKRQSPSAGGSDEGSGFDGSAGVRKTKGSAAPPQEPMPDLPPDLKTPTPNRVADEPAKRKRSEP
jgi:hypothetical protein